MKCCTWDNLKLMGGKRPPVGKFTLRTVRCRQCGRKQRMRFLFDKNYRPYGAMA